MHELVFVSLVKGERYLDEYRYLLGEFKKQAITYKKFTPAIFNFNKKLDAIKPYLNSTVVLMDTDHMLRGPVNIKLLDNIEEGIYVQYSRPYLIKDTLDNDIELNGYFDILKDLYGSSAINFLDESIIIFNIEKSEKRDKFISTWYTLIEATKANSPYRHSDQNYGALEGCMISIAAQEAGIPIYESKLKSFFQNFEHYGPVSGHKIKVNSSVV